MTSQLSTERVRQAAGPPRGGHPRALRALGWARRHAGLTVVAVILILTVLYPLLRLAWESVTGVSAGHSGLFANYRAAFALPGTLTSVRGTVLVTVESVAIALPVSVGLAWICSSTDAPLARAVAWLPVISLAISPLTLALGWLVLVSPRSGVLNVLLRDLFGSTALTGPFSASSGITVVIVLALHVIPYMYGPVYAAFCRVDANLVEAARSTGASGFTAFLTIVLPIVRPAILAGTLIAGVNAAASFSIPYILSGASGVSVLPTSIYSQVLAEGNTGLATALSSILTAITLIATLIYIRLLGRGSFATVGGKGLRPMRVALGRWRYPTAVALVAVLVLSFILPLAALCYLSFVGLWSVNVFSQPISFVQFQQIFDDPGALGAIWNSAWISAVSATLSLAVGFAGAIVLLRRRGLSGNLIRICFTLPLGVPPLVTGLAMLTAFIRPPLDLYGTVGLIVLGFAVLAMPVAFQYSESALRQVAAELAEAAAVTGHSPLSTLMRVTLPIVRRPLLVAWGTIFIILTQEIGVAIMVYTPSSIVGSVWMFNYFTSGLLPTAAAYSLLLTVMSALIVWMILRLNRERQ